MVTIILITDSKASIDILQNIQTIEGIKDTLAADMDVGLEIAELQQINSWASRHVVKVQSHITEEEALDKFDWACNNMADELATKAREFFSLQYVRNLPNGVGPGTKAGCKIEGRIINDTLYEVLKDHMGGGLKKFS